MDLHEKQLLLTLLISGSKQCGLDIDVFLDPLIYDLITLWDEAFKAYNAYRFECLTLRAMFLWKINDFLTYDNLSRCTTHGYKACPTFSDDTYAYYL